jgi:lipoyl(octanoyl) transferase
MFFPTVSHLGLVAYEPTWQAMRAWTAARTPDTPNALWLCEHPAVFTLGIGACDQSVVTCPSDMSDTSDIPIVRSDRGGRMTYHGPGQLLAYGLVDLHRAGYYVKEYVFRLEEALIRTLAHWGLTGHRVRGAPGVYVRLDSPSSHACLPAGFDHTQLNARCGLAKIAALGMKVSRHCTYHGLALNVDMNLEPFSRIHACGYEGLQTTDLSTMLGSSVNGRDVQSVLIEQLQRRLEP